MTAEVEKLEVLHCVGECHALRFKEVLYRDAALERPLRCSTRFLPGLPAAALSSPSGLHSDLVSALVAEGLCHLASKKGQANDLVVAHQRATFEDQIEAARQSRLEGRSLQAPLLLLFMGELDIHGLAAEVGPDFDFELPDDPGYGRDPRKDIVPFAALDLAIARRFAPLEAAVRTLVSAGFGRTIVHGLPPRSPRQPEVSRWLEGAPITPAFLSKLAWWSNRRLQRLCEKAGAFFVDTWDELAREGYLDDRFSIDGLHLAQSAAEPTLAAIATALGRGELATFNLSQYELLRSLAEERERESRATTIGERGWDVAPLAPLPETLSTELRRSERMGSWRIHQDWSGMAASAPGPSGLLRPTPETLSRLWSWLSLPAQQEFLSLGSAHPQLAVSLRILAAPACDPVLSGREERVPTHSRRALIVLGGAVQLRVDDRKGNPAAIRLRPGYGIHFVPSVARVTLESIEQEGLILQMGLVPRLPDESFLVVCTEGSDWPADPFCLPVGEMLTWPVVDGRFHHRWREVPGKTVKMAVPASASTDRNVYANSPVVAVR